MRVLWMSRHALTEEQLNDLAKRFGVSRCDLEVSHREVVFSADEWGGVHLIRHLIEKDAPDIIAGVFPANLLAYILTATPYGGFTVKCQGKRCILPLAIPVAEPSVNRKDFRHHHWFIME